MNREERQKFLEGRKGIGSSDVPKILGWSRFGGPEDAYDSIVSAIEGRVTLRETSFPAERGAILEPIAAERWCVEHDRDTSSIRRQPQRAHPDYPYMIANIDRQVLSVNGSGPAILEIKCPMVTKFLRVRDFGEVQEYQAQLQHQLAVYNYPVGYLGIYHPDFPQMLNIEVLRDDEFINKVLHPALITFWVNHVVPRKRPEPESDELTVEMPEAEGGRMVIDETQAFAARVRKWKESKDLLDTTKAVHAQNCQILKDYMEENSMAGVAGAGVRVHYRPQAGSMVWDLSKVANYLNDQGMEISEFKRQNKHTRPLKVIVDKDLTNSRGIDVAEPSNN